MAESPKFNRALIVGAGSGLSASLARDASKLDALCKETGARAYTCDASKPEEVAKLFGELDAGGAPDFVVYNASGRVRGPFVELDPAEVKRAIEVTAYGAFLVAREAARRMVPKKHGAIFLTGASAGVKGYPQSAPFAMGKFALRGLAQSMARELHPQGIHIAHFVIDGGIARADRTPSAPDALLDPDAIAMNYLNVLRQPRSVWAWEMEVRPWVEKF
jgi:NAD(P)-dependent dehydrogenase (short-subunit alcohol dehydrogenase family)